MLLDPKKLRFALSANGVDPATVKVVHDLHDCDTIVCRAEDTEKVRAAILLAANQNLDEFNLRYGGKIVEITAAHPLRDKLAAHIHAAWPNLHGFKLEIDMKHPIEILEPLCAWDATAQRMNASRWTEQLSSDELAELHRATIELGRQLHEGWSFDRVRFPLKRLAERLQYIQRELVYGRGFVVLRGMPQDWDDEAMARAFWGIGLHLGIPKSQTAADELLVNVCNKGRDPSDSTARFYETSAALDMHTDGYDFTGLLCLQEAATGGWSLLSSAVAVHNRMVKERPELAAELYRRLPVDFRDARDGATQWYTAPVFSRNGDRLKVFYLHDYILSSQRHADAPRLRPEALEALNWLHAQVQVDTMPVVLQRGDMQFIYNPHVLHGRTAFTDDPTMGQVRWLKRLWLQHY